MTNYDQQTIQLFANTRDSLKGRDASLMALIDFSEGNPLALFSDPFVFDALAKRGLVKENFAEWHEMFEVGMQRSVVLFELTDYGKAFVQWYMQPREMPTQMDMFGDEAL